MITRIIVMALTLVAIALFAACGSDPTPTPTPEPTATPPPTPMPTPTPEPPTPAPAAQSTGNLGDFVITPATTGKDLIDALSEEEASCIQSAFGDAIFQILLGTPLLMASADPSAAAPLFGCLAPENVVVLGVSFFTAQHPDWGPETRTCFVEVGMEHPDAILTGLGMDPGSPSAASEAHPYLLELYDCLSDVEKVEFLISFQDEVDRRSSTERDLIDVLPESDVACIRENLSEEQYAMLLETTIHEGFKSSDSLANCITEEGYVNVFVAITASQGGGLSEESLSCVADFAREHQHYVALINPDSYDLSTMAASEVTEIADDGLRMWQCLSDEEIRRMQEVSLGALAR